METNLIVIIVLAIVAAGLLGGLIYVILTRSKTISTTSGPTEAPASLSFSLASSLEGATGTFNPGLTVLFSPQANAGVMLQLRTTPTMATPVPVTNLLNIFKVDPSNNFAMTLGDELKQLEFLRGAVSNFDAAADKAIMVLAFDAADGKGTENFTYEFDVTINDWVQKGTKQTNFVFCHDLFYFAPNDSVFQIATITKIPPLNGILLWNRSTLTWDLVNDTSDPSESTTMRFNRENGNLLTLTNISELTTEIFTPPGFWGQASKTLLAPAMGLDARFICHNSNTIALSAAQTKGVDIGDIVQQGIQIYEEAVVTNNISFISSHVNANAINGGFGSMLSDGTLVVAVNPDSQISGEYLIFRNVNNILQRNGNEPLAIPYSIEDFNNANLFQPLLIRFTESVVGFFATTGGVMQLHINENA